MKQFLYILTIFSLASCSNLTEKRPGTQQVDSVPERTLPADNKKPAGIKNKSNEIPPDGKYRFDISFAEWQGKSMGETVTVIINDKSVTVIYEGEGKLLQKKKGDIIDEGKIMKHKTGVWIIGKNASDTQLDAIGGCSGGPAIIDFKNRKYLMC